MDVGHLYARIRKLEKENAQLKKEKESETAELRNELADAKSEIVNLGHHFDLEKKLCRNMVQCNANRLKEIDKLKYDLQIERSNVDYLEGRVSEYENKIAGLESEIETLKGEKAFFEDQSKDLQTKKNNLRDSFDTANEYLDRIHAVMNDYVNWAYGSGR